MRELPLSRAVRRRDDSRLKRKNVLLHRIDIYKFDQDICLKRNHGYANMNHCLPKRMKLLIAIVLDAVNGASDGVRSLAGEAIKAGATKEEIAEALRVAQYICGVGCLYTADRALKEVLI
jgi:alkylhydroperoxidase/carboxymuconolactone decarboxylase family protein YurZ